MSLSKDYWVNPGQSFPAIKITDDQGDCMAVLCLFLYPVLSLFPKLIGGSDFLRRGSRAAVMHERAVFLAGGCLHKGVFGYCAVFAL